ncbi:hypothetical protein F4813DRAFT_344603 [Daldinia decipiens]|uniref:uncharacterized protein n=1 Tax=Daldinia decipiens TaxID=326647 RepID=UPI0020C3A87D|nr:uncharacterized protein F4813DRAFT_344603 [Daldinia decipiens]KAI1662461.1 hypothetical protein F4813DRAFT_344603 [Daldinia decipiens]
MKYSFTLVALAAGLSQVTATGFGFHNAPQFTCPDNTNNVCIPDIVKGIDWSDLPFGGFDSYKGFNWSGFTCSEKFGKRDQLTARTFQSKCITGTAQQDKGKSPKISCDNSKGVTKTSIKKFQVSPEFDCDLEFHYTMPDGSACKHRSSCKASGTVVENTQCGGATDVTVVYPKQPSIPKESCDFGIHHIDFDCEAPKPSTPTKPDTPSSSSAVVSSSASFPASSISTSSVAVSSSASYPASSAFESSSAVVSSSASVSESTSSSSATTSLPIGVSSTVSIPVESATTSLPIGVSSTVSVPVESASSSVATLSYPGADSTTASTEAASSTTDVSSLSVTSYLTTSTVFTTSVQTITSCGPSVSNCPAGSNTVVTVTLPLSTTISPVTETIGISIPAVSIPSVSLPSISIPAISIPSVSLPAISIPSVSIPATKLTESAAKPTESSVESTPVGPSGTSPASSSSSTPAGPVETLPCPNVVPSCLNTWMFSVGCKDNTDSACYCPDASFVKNIFTCLYAHGESDEVISEAISYFQGICAPFVPSNPGIATGAESITTILTATPTAPPAAVTTIEVATTVVVPCTNEAGETIPSSSSTVTIHTSLTVPGIVFSTATNGPSSTGVVIVPGTYVATVPAATPTAATPASTPAPTGAAPYPTIGGSSTLVTAAPPGTGVTYPTSSPSSSTVIVTAGAAHVGAGMGLLGFAGMVVAAAL